MIEIIIILICLILFPFYVYVLSKVQMAGWLAGYDSYLISEERNTIYQQWKKEKERQNGEKTESE